MSYKCMMCQQPITKNEDEWGMEFSLTKWMHYKCIEHLWDAYSSMRKSTPDTRVRCTKDGEFPKEGRFIRFDVGKLSKHYGHIVLSNNGEQYFVDRKQPDYRYFTKHLPEPIYWRYEKPLTSLKSQYERERGETEP